MVKNSQKTLPDSWTRRHFIGGSDARIIMGSDEQALVRLWREKRGEIEPEDLSGNLVVQLGVATEDLNRRWYEANTGQVITDIQKRVRHPALRWMGATLDGRVEGSDARVRGQVHAAVVVFGGSRGREIHGAAAA
jgi:predicted phage-related endonuclease